MLLLAIGGAIGLTFLALGQRNVAQQERDNARQIAAESQYIALTASAQTALRVTGNIELAMALALQAVRLDPQKPNAQTALSEAAYSPGTIRRFVGHNAAVKNIAISPDGRTMVSASDDMTLILWDIETGAIIRRFEGHTDKVMTVAFSPDGRTILSGANNNEGSKDTDLILWEVETGDIIRRFKGHTAGLWGVAFSPDGRMALSGGSDTIPILWDVETGQIIRRFVEEGSGHQGVVESPVFSPDGRTALTGSWDATFILWDIETAKVIRRFGAAGEGHVSPRAKGRLQPSGRTALSGAQSRPSYCGISQPGKSSGASTMGKAGSLDWRLALTGAPFCPLGCKAPSPCGMSIRGRCFAASRDIRVLPSASPSCRMGAGLFPAPGLQTTNRVYGILNRARSFVASLDILVR